MSQRPSRFFPPSALSFQEEMDRLRASGLEHTSLHADLAAQLNALSEAQARFRASVQEYQSQERDGDTARWQLLNKAAECLDAVSEMLSGIQKTHQELQAKADSLIGGISGLYQKDFPINVQFEREYYKDFPVCATPEAPDFQEDFLRLIDGLDEESVETVVLALQRLKLIQNSKDPSMAPYSSEEKQVFRHLVEHFYSNILELSETCYFYRGYLLPINHFEPGVFVEKLMLPELVHPERLADKDIIDAGAFIGDSALILSPYTSKKVYAFEPTPGNYELLLKTIEMNALTNVVPCNFALGEQEGMTSISPSGSASTQFENTAFHYGEKSEVPVTTLDGFVKEHDLRVGLIKADIEGAESLMLKGAEETLRTQRPALLISIYHNAHDYFKIKPWLEGLDLGYKFKIRHSTGGTVLTETILIAEVS